MDGGPHFGKGTVWAGYQGHLSIDYQEKWQKNYETLEKSSGFTNTRLNNCILLRLRNKSTTSTIPILLLQQPGNDRRMCVTILQHVMVPC